MCSRQQGERWKRREKGREGGAVCPVQSAVHAVMVCADSHSKYLNTAHQGVAEQRNTAWYSSVQHEPHNLHLLVVGVEDRFHDRPGRKG